MKLSDTHLVLLSAAAQRTDHALKIPADMDLADTEKLVAKLAGAGLIEEIDAAGELPVWRRVDDAAFALRITAEGLEAIGVDEGTPVAAGVTNQAEQGSAPSRTKSKATGPARKSAKVRKAKPRPAKGANRKPARAANARKSAQPKASRSGTKLDEVKTLLLRKRGATIKEMMDATSWLPHTTRAVLTGFRKRGFGVEREQVKDKPSIYRITGGTNSAARSGARGAGAA